MTPDICEEFHRIVLRTRWLKWLSKQPSRVLCVAHLSQRLTRWKPTYDERELAEPERIDDECD